MASRWARLADWRAAELLAAASRGGPALVVVSPGGFPPPAAGGPRLAVTPEALARAPAVEAVLDTTRPEGPGDPAPRVAAMVRACRAGGTIAAIACGGAPGAGGSSAPLGLARLGALLEDAGCRIVELVPFDLLGPLSPWRLGLGPRAGRVLEELDEHLRHRSVRRAVRLLEREVVATLPPERVGRVLVRAERAPAGEGGVPRPRLAPRMVDPAPLSARLAAPALARRVLKLMQEDAVVRFAAFVDAELLSAQATGFDLARYLGAASLEAESAGPARARAERRGRCWYPGLDARRFVEAAAFRLVRRTVETLGAAGGAGVADTLTYHLLETINAELDRHLGPAWPAP